MLVPGANSTAEFNESTLLIPEDSAWVPYFGLVMTVLLWLGYDFYRFHRKNMEKYARIMEHITILRATPSRQRISMVSGIGLRFRRGKPILGDVWNTSPSSSDLSSCFETPRSRVMSYSREVTPSDEGADDSGEDLFPESLTGSCADLVTHEVHNSNRKGWEVGGELVSSKSIGGNQQPHDQAETEIKEWRMSVYSDKGPDQTLLMPSPEEPKLPPMAPFPQEPGLPCVNPSTSSTKAAAKMGVDVDPLAAGVSLGAEASEESAGGSPQPSHKDVATQTSINDFPFNVTPQYDSFGIHPGHGHRHSIANPYSMATPYSINATPHRLPRHVEVSEDDSSFYQAESAQTGSRASSLNMFHLGHSFDSRSPDSPIYGTLPKKRHPPPLRLDLLSGPYSPTTEIVATKHGFALEGMEVPSYPGGSRSLPSRGSDLFKPSTSKNLPFLKPLNPSPAVTSRVPTAHPLSSRHSLDAFSSHYTAPVQPAHYYHSQQQQQQQHHHHRHRRQHSLTLKTSENVQSRSQSLLRQSSQTIPESPSSSIKHRRQRGSQKKPKKDSGDANGDVMSLKTLKEKPPDPEQTDPIPAHLFHQDEEGFFSSVSSTSPTRRGNARDGEDGANKGILFFSRLAGLGRNQEGGSSGGGGGGRQHSGTFKSGGFDS